MKVIQHIQKTDTLFGERLLCTCKNDDDAIEIVLALNRYWQGLEQSQIYRAYAVKDSYEITEYNEKPV